MPGRKRKQNTTLPVVIIAAGVLILLGAVLFIIDPFGSLDPIPTEPAAQIPHPEIPRVSLADARAAFETGTAIFLDVRSEAAYAAGHVSGAVNIPENELPQRLNELNPSDWIITYCT